MSDEVFMAENVLSVRVPLEFDVWGFGSPLALFAPILNSFEQQGVRRPPQSQYGPIAQLVRAPGS